jgi:hypothetical protein
MASCTTCAKLGSLSPFFHRFWGAGIPATVGGPSYHGDAQASSSVVGPEEVLAHGPVVSEV